MDQNNGQPQYRGTKGLSLAIVIGVAIGTVIGKLMDNMNTGLMLGLVIGAILYAVQVPRPEPRLFCEVFSIDISTLMRYILATVDRKVTGTMKASFFTAYYYFTVSER